MTFEVNTNNNFVLDVCKLQTVMVRFYDMYVPKCGETLKFVIKLDESDVYYHLHQGSMKEKKKYIISTIVPKQNLNESLVKCKIDGTALYIEIPINCFVK